MKRALTLLVLVLITPALARSSQIVNSREVLDSYSTLSEIQIDPNKPIKVVVSSDSTNSRGLDPWWKDVIDAASKIAAVMGIGLTFLSIVIAAVLAYGQFTRNRQVRENELEERKERLEQRKQELSWKKEEAKQKSDEVRREKANLARTVLSDMSKDSYANDAMSMLDWDQREYDVRITPGAPASVQTITERDIWAALRRVERHFVPKERYIRDCFDHFFGVMQQLEYYINIDLIDAGDVRDPFAYFAGLMNDDGRWIYEYFITAYHPNSGKFLQRFPKWTNCLVCDGAKSGPGGTCQTCGGTGQYAMPISAKAFFIFDCPPGEDRFICMLDDSVKIRFAREQILTEEEELHLRGMIIDSPAHYNEPWNFHLDPSTTEFVENDSEFADQINTRVETQLSKGKVVFARNDVWHYGGARLLAEVPADRFEPDQAWSQAIEKLNAQGRIAKN